MTVLPGVKIGDGAIIGANSVVTKDVAPYTIVGGNPIQLIRPRFEPEVIQALENLAWWNKDIEWITANVPKLMQTTPTLELINSLMEK